MADPLLTILSIMAVVFTLACLAFIVLMLLVARLVIRVKRRLLSLALPSPVQVRHILSSVLLYARSHIKGRMGEGMTRLSGHFQLPSSMRAFHDITLRDSQGGTTQIDHLYIGPTGVFVVEGKNFGGKILGQAHEAKWTQVLNFRRKYQFQNPLRQNYRHIAVLADLLNVPRAQVNGVVVFSPRAEFPRGMPEGVFTTVTFPRYIRSFSEVRYSTRQVESWINTIEQNRLPGGLLTHLSHVAYLRARHDRKQQAPKSK